MCQACDKAVIEFGILESDLPNLPYELKYWYCCAYDCLGKTRVRDYGISPYYFWPVKVIREIKKGVGRWRGGWIEFEHTYICSKHWPEYKKSPSEFYKRNVFKPLDIWDADPINEYLSGKIVDIPKQKKIYGFQKIHTGR